ncbi:MAG TPA: relaxase/mobilization nuclease domain-containing protein [Burkholderiales bacterium]|nr:relaxase/mobilization nuclease domain-containing protein [Burkholderiales bacterium]
MSGLDDKDKDLLGPHRMVRASMRGRHGPPREVRASKISVAERLRIARGVPQALVKVTSYVRGREGCRRHWYYISRKGKLALETETGELLSGRDEQRAVLDAWALSFDKRKNARDQVNVVVSALPGTSPEAVRRAARAFGQEAFAGQRYVFVLHDDKKHPHVHFAVALRGAEKKLDPRLKELHRWRELWAEKARQQGIELACSPRAARGVGRRRPPTTIYQMQRRGVTPQVIVDAVKETVAKGADAEWERYTRERNAAERQAYRQSAAQLRAAAKKTAAGPERVKFETAADELEQFAQRMPVAKTRRQQLREALALRQKQKTLTKTSDDLER